MLVLLAPTMDIDEAAVIVQGPRSSHWSAALSALGRFVEAEATKARANRAEAEDIAQEVVLKLLPKFDAGEVPWCPGAHRAYLKQCAKHAVIDLSRATARRAKALRSHPVEQPDAGADADGIAEILRSARDLLEKVVAAARQRRAPRYRQDFDETWSQLCALARGATLRELVEAPRKGLERDEQAYVKTRNAVYKAHERLRTALLAAVVELRASGKLTHAEAELATRALGVFVRCQRRAPLHVTQEKGPA